jgi:pyruvate dehydrogenase E2 component (dihydrolipoamide acetyltransferase)
VVRWLKQEGDAVKPGDPLVELETEKVSYELESPAAGVLLKVIAQEAAEVPVGDPLCQIGEPKDAPTQSRKKGASHAKASKPKSGKVKK